VRLVHLADLHLGFRQYHRLTADGINQREADVEIAFRRAVDRVIDLRPDIVVIAGDVFHTVRPMNPAIVHAFVQFSRLRAALPGAVIVMVAGNHDRPRSNETGSILRLFEQLGIVIAIDEPRRLPFPDRDLFILAVPDLASPLPPLEPEPGARYNVLVLHGEVEGMLPEHMARVDRAVMEIPQSAIGPERWSYVALGHYHVHREIAPNTYYSGSLEYTSANPWGELVEEKEAALSGKGFIEYDLDARAMIIHPLATERPLVNLAAVSAKGMSAPELDAAIRERVEGCPGGIDEKIVRLVVRDVPRHVARELDQKALREFKRRALHFHLDTRRPEMARAAVSGAPGRRATLTETVEHYLSRRPLDSGVDRAALVSLGLQYLQEADAAAQAAGAQPAGDGGEA
jgi:DNA repair protein SbcD/Mre11